jgi:hypothetical protein
MRRAVHVFVVLVIGLVASACSGDGDTTPTEASGSTVISAPGGTVAVSSNPAADGRARNQVGYVFPDAPIVSNKGDLDPETQAALDDLWDSLGSDIDDRAIFELGQSGDVRLAWLLVDVLRFVQGGPISEALIAATTELTGIDPSADPVAARSPSQSLTDHLIAWDVPAISNYRDYKGRLFTIIEPAWQPFFDDAEAAIDWRFTSWGGVLIDDRPLGATAPCERGCIPALDDPPTTSAAGGSWYPDDRVVFGVVVNGEALTGPLHDQGVVLQQATVVTSTWGEWKLAHRDTTILASDGGLGRTYPLDPLRGRDDNGPIFPIGDVDSRLPTQAQVVGVIRPDGTPVAFAVEDLSIALGSRDSVEFSGILVMKDGGGFTATLSDGTPVASHQAFWFAWSQFHPETLVYSTG